MGNSSPSFAAARTTLAPGEWPCFANDALKLARLFFFKEKESEGPPASFLQKKGCSSASAAVNRFTLSTCSSLRNKSSSSGDTRFDGEWNAPAFINLKLEAWSR